MTENGEVKVSYRTEQLVSARDLAMKKFMEGMALIAEASALCGVSLFSHKIMKPCAYGLPESLPGSIETGRREIDRHAWTLLFRETGMDRYWNHKQREAFRNELDSDPPVASIDVIRDTLVKAVVSRRDTLAEGFVGLLTELDRSFRSNRQQYTMPRKFVLRGLFPEKDSLRYNGYSTDNLVYLRDFENIVCICSGASTPGTGYDMTDRLTALRSTDYTGDVVNDLGWRCRLYANGNVHISIETNALLDSLNSLIGTYFAGQLADRKSNDI